jgi:hypothetical protein
MLSERIGRFFKNLLAALGRSVIEEPEVLCVAVPVLICLAVLWLAGMTLYSFIFEPHLPTMAALDSLSINADNWFP